jgi:hypothetical protein
VVEVNPKDPKTLVVAILSLAAVGGLGSTLGLTVEPEETTQLRVDKAQLEVRVEYLTGIVEQCDDLLTAARVRALEE